MVALDITFEALAASGVRQQVWEVADHPSLGGVTVPKPNVMGIERSSAMLRVTVRYFCRNNSDALMIKMAASN